MFFSDMRIFSSPSFIFNRLMALFRNFRLSCRLIEVEACGRPPDVIPIPPWRERDLLLLTKLQAFCLLTFCLLISNF